MMIISPYLYQPRVEPSKTAFYVSGGYDGGSVLAIHEKYSVAGGAWSTKTNLPANRHGTQNVGQAGLLYNVGQGGVAGRYAFSEGSNSWATKTAPSQSHQLGVAAPIGNDKTYDVVGYNTDGTQTGVNDEYNTATDSNTTKLSCPLGTTYTAGVGFHTLDYLFVTGGLTDDASVPRNENYRYSQTSNSWLATTAMASSQRSHFQATIGDNNFYACSGVVGGAGSSTVREYSVTGDSWTTKTGTPNYTASACCSPAGTDQIIAQRGVYPFGDVTVWSYTKSANAWATLTSANYGRAFAGGNGL